MNYAFGDTDKVGRNNWRLKHLGFQHAHEQNSPPKMVDLAILALSLLELKSPISTMTEQAKNTQLRRVNRLVSEIARIGQVPNEHTSTSKSGQTRSF